MTKIVLVFVLLLIVMSCTSDLSKKALHPTTHVYIQDPNVGYITGTINYYTSEIKADRYNYSLFLKRADQYIELGKYTNKFYYEKLATKDYDEAIRLNSRSPVTYKLRGKLKASLGMEDDALEDYDKYIKLVPEDVDALLSRAYLLKELGDTIRAATDYARARDLKEEQLNRYEKYRNIRYPKSVDEAVRFLMVSLSSETREIIKETRYADLINYHFSLGMYIRNEFALWSGNRKLLKSCGSENMHPDDASMVIIKELWKTLQQDL